jgi:hypothetical protein
VVKGLSPVVQSTLLGIGLPSQGERQAGWTPGSGSAAVGPYPCRGKRLDRWPRATSRRSPQR